MPPIPIDFFNPVFKKSTSAVDFGLCDDQPPPYGVPAYLDLNVANKNEWTAIVENTNAQTIYFYPVDCGVIQNNTLYQVGAQHLKGGDTKKCDVLLVYNDTAELKFVELKDKDCPPSEWLEYEDKSTGNKKGALPQLKATIDLFNKTHPNHTYQLTAHAANKMRPNPVSTKNYPQEFYDETGVLLRITQKITIE